MLVPVYVATPPELLRPQFHFTAPSGWLNDPNGLVYENGTYHLFYQHNPFGTEWGNMTWGHAVSRDLLHWQDLANAIEPDDFGTIFSGSAIMDMKNVSGFGRPNNPAMLCFYTAAGGTNDASKGKPFTQCLAYSLDGKNFTKFSGNPIVANIADGNRDPKVVWDPDHKCWIMALYLTNATYAFLGSHNLRSWTKVSEISTPGTDECPDLFQLDYKGKKKWVFWGANGRYMVGSFDGKSFVPETPMLPSNFGNTGYAAQTYSNSPNGRRIQIAWMNNSNFPGCPWNQQMAFPTELSLRETPEGPRLSIMPVREVQSLHKGGITERSGAYPVASGLMDIEGNWQIPERGILELEVNGVPISFDGDSGTLHALDRDAHLDTRSKRLHLRILADRTTVEIYAQNGLTFMPLFRLPQDADFQGVKVAGSWKGSVKVFELSSTRS